MILVTGGSSSGKSAYAEMLLSDIRDMDEKYYIATMKIWDAEGQKRVEKHRQMRAGKGFVTIEQPTDAVQALEKMTWKSDGGSEKRNRKSCCALLECMSNLTANEMFTGQGVVPESQVAKKIVAQVQTLANQLSQLIIVTNNVFEDGVEYDESTLAYMRALGKINRRLAVQAERVIEVVAGIPVIITA